MNSLSSIPTDSLLIPTTDRGLVVSEQFYSIQGEGANVGMPAVFLRLGGCNLQCPGFTYRDPRTQQHLGCDTKAVWTQGKRIMNVDLLTHWQQAGWLAALAQGAHLILTGGEPFIQQANLFNFVKQLDTMLNLATSTYVEIETNATVTPQLDFLQRIQQINASPKLAHSGEEKARRYKPDVIATLNEHANAYFKFVVSTVNDIDEIVNDFLTPFQIASHKVLLMPEGGTRQDVVERGRLVVELCKQYGFRYSPRLHIDLYGEVTGV